MRMRLTALLLAALFVLPASLLAYLPKCAPVEVAECALRPVVEGSCARESCPRGPQQSERGCSVCVVGVMLYFQSAALHLPTRMAVRSAFESRHESAESRPEAPPRPPPKA